MSHSSRELSKGQRRKIRGLIPLSCAETVRFGDNSRGYIIDFYKKSIDILFIVRDLPHRSYFTFTEGLGRIVKVEIWKSRQEKILECSVLEPERILALVEAGTNLFVRDNPISRE